jgi:hypothetical protein
MDFQGRARLRNLLPFFILGSLIIVTIIAIMLPQMIFADHLSQHEEWIVHPTNPYGFNQPHELVLTMAWIQPIHVYEPFNELCARNYELTPDGECKREYLQWHIYPVRLMQELPKTCSVKAIACVTDTGIHILNGKQGTLPNGGGCSVLYHEILHIVWFEIYPDPEDAHDWFAIKYPNSECSNKSKHS